MQIKLRWISARTLRNTHRGAGQLHAIRSGALMQSLTAELATP
jgi:hypothetical protein